MQQVFRIESSHLTYHLESLGDLIFKTEDGKYTLSSLGEAAASIMQNVEEHPKTLLRPTFPSNRWKVLFSALLMALILTSALCFFQYRTLIQLSSQYTRLRTEHELIMEALRDALDLENFVLTYEYAENGSVASSLLTFNDSAPILYLPYGWLIGGRNWYSLYGLTSNSTLEIEISFTNPLPPNAFLDIMILEPSKEGGSSFGIVQINASQQTHKSFSFVGVWGTTVAQNDTRTGAILSRGQHAILISAPNVRTPEEFFVMNYTMTLRIKSQGNYVPFFAKMGF